MLKPSFQRFTSRYNEEGRQIKDNSSEYKLMKKGKLDNWTY